MILSQEEKQTVQKVLEHLMHHGIFNGRYDAINGNEHFMIGVGTVMECLAYLVSDNYGDYVSTTFAKNVVESQKKG